MNKLNYYEILQIRSSASAQQIEESYLRLAKTCQATVTDLEGFVHKMKILNEAYLSLIDPESRGEYDEKKMSNDSLSPFSIPLDGQEDDDDDQAISVEIDHESATRFNFRVESCSAFLEDKGWATVIGEISSLGPNPNKKDITVNYYLYASDGRLLGEGSLFLKKTTRKQSISHDGISFKPKKIRPAKIVVRFEEYE